MARAIRIQYPGAVYHVMAQGNQGKRVFDRTYVESRVLELASKAGREELEREWKELRRGWYVGGESFLEKLEQRTEGALAGRRRESVSGGAKARHDEVGSEVALERGLKVLGVSEQ